jgi:hypothetical protein
MVPSFVGHTYAWKEANTLLPFPGYRAFFDVEKGRRQK